MLLQITEMQAVLIEYGIVGIFILFLIGLIALQQKTIDKKDDQILDVTHKSIEAFGAMSSLISIVSEATKNMPERVRDKMKDDVNMLKETINSLKT